MKKTFKTLDKIVINQNQIKVLLKKIQAKKSHGHDGISARLLKLADDSISYPLFIIYTNCLAKGIFPSKWKKANVSPIYKKKTKKTLDQIIVPSHYYPYAGKSSKN